MDRFIRCRGGLVCKLTMQSDTAMDSGRPSKACLDVTGHYSAGSLDTQKMNIARYTSVYGLSCPPVTRDDISSQDWLYERAFLMLGSNHKT